MSSAQSQEPNEPLNASRRAAKLTITARLPGDHVLATKALFTMYRQHATALAMGMNTNALLPSPAHDEASASESESETIAALDRKRRQLDEEIAHFKAQKDKEFRDFELQLRRKRKRKRSPAEGENHLARTPPTDPSVLSLLGSRPQANGHAHHQNGQVGLRTTPVVPPSKPTLSIEKLTIVGTNAPPAATDAPPNVLARSLTSNVASTGNEIEKGSSFQPIFDNLNNTKQEPPLTPIARDHNDSFAGLFTPSYLPLLDSRTSSSISVPKTLPQPAKRLPADSKPQTTQPGSSSSSLPSSPISPKIPSPARRSYTAPLLPSNASFLPSALRVASANSASTKKMKHVTFRLADSSVVEPSSSYEEMSSPDLPSETANGKAKAKGIDEILAREDVPWSWSKGPTSPIVEKNDGMSLAGDGEEDEDQENGLYMDNGSSSKIVTNETPPLTSPGPLKFDEAEDGGSGVGFFELEEELNSPSPGLSPRVRSPRSDRSRFFEDWGAMPDDDEDDEAVRDESRGEAYTTEEAIAAELEAASDEEDVAEVEAEVQGLGISNGKERETIASTFTSGSVPIDIVMRPSSSWVGSLGNGSVQESNYVP